MFIDKREKRYIFIALFILLLHYPFSSLYSIDGKDTNHAITLIMSAVVVGSVGYVFYKIHNYYSLKNAQTTLEKNQETAQKIMCKEIHMTTLTPHDDEHLAHHFWNKQEEYEHHMDENRQDQNILSSVQQKTTQDIQKWQNSSRASFFVSEAQHFTQINKKNIEFLKERLDFLKERQALIKLAALLYTESKIPFAPLVYFADGASSETELEDKTKRIYLKSQWPLYEAQQEIGERKTHYEKLTANCDNFKSQSSFSTWIKTQGIQTLHKYQRVQELLTQCPSYIDNIRAKKTYEQEQQKIWLEQEKLRIEKARVQAEQERAYAEQQRAEAEALKAQAESRKAETKKQEIRSNKEKEIHELQVKLIHLQNIYEYNPVGNAHLREEMEALRKRITHLQIELYGPLGILL